MVTDKDKIVWHLANHVEFKTVSKMLPFIADAVETLDVSCDVRQLDGQILEVTFY